MKTALLSVGTEILMGQITNTNSVYLSKELNDLGHDVLYHHTVGDNSERLKETLDLLFHDCDLIITTGGLGPTQDDLTKETVCAYMEDELVLNEEWLGIMEKMFSGWNRKMTDNNLKQAYLPSRAVMYKNPHGTAPGFCLENKGKYIICLPGPPREMKELFELYARPFLESKTDSVIVYHSVRTYGIGESQLETQLLDLIDAQTDPTLATYAKENESYVRIASKRRTRKEAEDAIADMLVKVRERIGKYIYSEDNEDLWNVVVRKLRENGLMISAAESCTGGLFAKTITDIAGASDVFDRSIVTYSNRAKMEELGVSAETLEKYGAVSEQTAREMAEGIARVSGSDICVSVTGIAGPGGGTEEKPVGLIYIGLWYDGETKVQKLMVRDTGRVFNRHRAMLAMMGMVNKCLDEKVCD